MTKDRVKGMCSGPLRYIGFADRNSARGLQFGYRRIRVARDIICKERRAVGCGHTAEVVVILNCQWQTPERAFEFGGCSLLGQCVCLFTSTVQTQGRQGVDLRVYRLYA